MKTVNIDEYLQANGVEIQLGDKTFIVKDIPYELRAKLASEEKDEKALVADMLQCESTDLDGYGLAAFAAIIKAVTENLFRAPSSADGQ